jgi:hypothetical protein
MSIRVSQSSCVRGTQHSLGSERCGIGVCDGIPYCQERRRRTHSRKVAESSPRSAPTYSLIPWANNASLWQATSLGRNRDASKGKLRDTSRGRGHGHVPIVGTSGNGRHAQWLHGGSKRLCDCDASRRLYYGTAGTPDSHPYEAIQQTSACGESEPKTQRYCKPRCDFACNPCNRTSV